MKKICIVLMLLSCTIAALPLYAQGTPEQARQEAFDNVKVALKLAGQAQKMISGPTTKENVKAAIGLYVEAGQLLEKSEAVFKALGPQYVSGDDLDQCTRTKEDCITTIKRLKESLGN